MTVVFGQGSLNYTNAKRVFDPPTGHEVIRLSSDSPKILYQQLQQHLTGYSEPPSAFPDIESLRRWFDERQKDAFGEWVDRRLFIRMSDAEVQAAQRKLHNRA